MPLQSETIANWIAGTPSADIIRLHVARGGVAGAWRQNAEGWPGRVAGHHRGRVEDTEIEAAGLDAG